MAKKSYSTSNRLLSRLGEKARDLVWPHLTPVDLPLRTRMENAGKTIEQVCFMERGMASIVASTKKRSIEVGIVGREGMTGLAVLMGADSSPHDTYIQIAGAGQSIPAEDLRQLVAKNPELQQTLLRYAHAFIVQASQTALANGHSKIESRLARWLLMAQDRVDGNEVPLTHEFLSLMLGVRRAGVSVALQSLADEGLIETKRGTICVLSRKGLEKIADGTYGTSEMEFQRLFG